MMASQVMAVDEQELIIRVKANKEAFLEIYDNHFQRIYNYVFYRTFNQTDAEELTSQIFLSALERIDRYEYRNIPIIVWLYKIASNAVIDFYRKKGQTVGWEETSSNLKDEEPSPEIVYMKKAEKEQLLEYLRQLPLMQQQAVVLRYLHSFSYKEISEIMDKTEGSIKQLLHRGLNNLRERMVNHE